MSHLILPIDIEESKYCPTYKSNRMTTGVLTSFQVIGTLYNAEITTPESPWKLAVLAIGDFSGDGEVSFGVACGDRVTVRITVNDTSSIPDYFVTIAVNGSTYSTFVDGDPPLDIVINLSDQACGNVITLSAIAERGDLDAPSTDGVLTVTAEVTSIT